MSRGSVTLVLQNHCVVQIDRAQERRLA
ncbi:MAG: DUF2292 domain-containing protein [Dehalococcoidia bacterium]